MKKYVRDGHVAVVISIDFGAGWSTWSRSPEEQLQKLFDPGIVDYILNKNLEHLSQYINLKYPSDSAFDPENLGIHWLPEGTEFFVHEYDGLEKVYIKENVKWITA